MPTKPRYRLANRPERTIAISRVILAASSLFAVWLDPAEPARNVGAMYTLHAAYVVYSMVLAAVMWDRPSRGPLPITTHIIDIGVFSALQYLTLGPSSPFFVYFIFSLFCAALRWGYTGTLRTGALVLGSYVLMGAWMSGTAGPLEFELNRFVIRVVYLAMTVSLLAYQGQHETRLRSEIERLARWPAAGGSDPGVIIQRALEHAATLLAAGRAVVLWEVDDEPWTYSAAWPPPGRGITRHGPGKFEPQVPEPLTGAAILCAGDLTDNSISSAVAGGRMWEFIGQPVHRSLQQHLGTGLASAPFRTDRIAGRVFFSDLEDPTSELLSLTEVVAREVGGILDQVQSSEQLKEIAVREQRIRLARDLHDGVLQSLTGVRLELQSLATTLAGDTADTRDRLRAIDRVVTMEQRELRVFIEQLRPAATGGPSGTLARGLEAMRDRIVTGWKLPVMIRVATEPAHVPDELQREVPLMVHEAIVNALKHARASRILVDVDADETTLKVTVSDDGTGFPFRGRYEHDVLVRMNAGPASLRERAMALGGKINIDSTGSGSRVEITVPVALVEV